MIEVKQGMDPHSLEIMRDEIHLGFLQWHPTRPPRIILTEDHSHLELSEVRFLMSIVYAEFHGGRWESWHFMLGYRVFFMESPDLAIIEKAAYKNDFSRVIPVGVKS